MRNGRAEWLPTTFGRVLLVVFLATAAAASTSAPAFAASQERIVVSLGDSYSSGEGNPPFYGQDALGSWVNDYERWLTENGDDYPFLGRTTKATEPSKGERASLDWWIHEGDSQWLDCEDYTAHRSTASWPGQLMLDEVQLSTSRYRDVGRGAKWYFYASSGAVSANIYQDRQPKNTLDGGVRVQLDAAREDLTEEERRRVAYVTMTIGGNDIGFSDIVQNVALKGLVDRDYLTRDLDQAWVNYDGSPRHAEDRTDLEPDGTFRRDQIAECYHQVCETFPNAQIIVAGYPTLMNDNKWLKYLKASADGSSTRWDRFVRFFDATLSEGIGFADWEAWIVNKDAREFNKQLEELVDRVNSELEEEASVTARLHYVSVEDGFETHEAYTDIPFLNGVDLLNVSYSFHPNKEGLRVYKEAVQSAIKELEDAPLVAYLDDDQPDADEAYASYASKLEEYVNRYGGPRVVSGGSTWSVSGDGVCLAELVDFDGDGLEELYLAYYDPDNESTEYDWSSSGHDANAYVIEVWSFVDGELRMAYQGQASSSQQGLAYCRRAILDGSGEGPVGHAVSWIHYSGYAGGDYSSSLWSIDGGSVSMEHEWRIVGEFTPDMRWLADGEETNLDEGEWLDIFVDEWKSYALMDFAQDEHVSECIDLAKETMHRLGVTVPASERQGDVSGQIQAIEDLAGSSVVWVHTTDFDGDGAEETFGITGESYGSNYREGKAWRSARLWYASSTGEAQSVASFDRIVYVNDVFDDPAGSGYQLLSLELTAGGSGASSKVYGVQRDIPREIQVSGREVQAQEGRIILAKDFFGEAGGHMLEWHELTFDQSSFALVEGPSLGVTELFELPSV